MSPMKKTMALFLIAFSFSSTFAMASGTAIERENTELGQGSGYHFGIDEAAMHLAEQGSEGKILPRVVKSAPTLGEKEDLYNILLIEDQTIPALVLGNILENFLGKACKIKTNIIVKKTVKDGIDAFKNQNFLLVFVDFNLIGKMTGDEVIENLMERVEDTQFLQSYRPLVVACSSDKKITI